MNIISYIHIYVYTYTHRHIYKYTHIHIHIIYIHILFKSSMAKVCVTMICEKVPGHHKRGMFLK